MTGRLTTTKSRLFLLAIAVPCIVLIISASSIAQDLRSSSSGSSRLGLKSSNNNFCQGCRSLVSFMTRFNSSSTRSDSKKLVQSYCESIYPVSTDYQQGPCPIFVEGFFWFMDRIDPVNHCDQIGACGGEDSSIASVELTSGADGNVSVSVGGPICDICEQSITTIQGFLDNPTAVDLIKRRLTSFCDYLAVINETKECRQMIESYIDEAIDFVRQIDALKYCQSIQLCSANYKKPSVASSQNKLSQALASFQGFGIETKTVIGDQVVKDISVPERVEGGHSPVCMFCKTFIKEMFKFLRENRTEEGIRDGLDKICKLVYRKNQAEFEHCEQLVATYSRELIQLLIDETDPKLICVLIEQCTYQKTSPLSIQEPVKQLAPKMNEEQKSEPVDLNMFISMLDPSVQPSSIATCVECKIFIQYLRNSLNDPKSVEHVHQWLLTNLCDSLEEKKAKDSCYNMVNNYAEIFFKAIATDLDPKKACIELKACTQRFRQQVNIINNRPIIEKKIKSQVLPVTQPKSQFCDQCVQIVTQIDDYLSSHPIDHDVSVLIDQVCMKLPNDEIQKECIFMIRAFGQDIAQAIANMDSPKQLCSKIMLC